MIWLERKSKIPTTDPEPVKATPPRFKDPIEIMDKAYWQCTRCGCLVTDAELELHSNHHRVLDILLEKLMIGLEKFDG